MHKKLYNACPKKIQARHQTIIEAYRHLFGKKLPEAKQYWTLCSRQVDDEGNILDGSELEQVSAAGLIKESQFYGVDIEPNVIEMNSKHIPGAHWFCGNLYTILSKANSFDPAIVNCDLIAGPKRGAFLVGNTLALLTRRKVKNVMVVVNFILKSRFNPDVGIEAIVEQLNKTTNFRFAFSEGGWKIYKSNKIYCYEGTGKKSTTKMGSIIFYRT